MAGLGFGHWYGRIVVRMVGPNPERLINMAVEAGIYLRSVERPSEDTVVATMSGRDFRRMRSVARRRWKLTIVKRVGWAFAFVRLARRRGLVIGGVAALATLYVLSSFIWFVDVQGTAEVSNESIMGVARQAGLHPGVSKRAFSAAVVERELLLTLQRLAWVNVEVWGTLATISVAERIVPENTSGLPGDIVAATAGVVEKVVTLRGIPMVREGEPVVAGQLLISGLIPTQAPEHKEMIDKGEPPYICAQGIVRARVWERAVAEGALTRQEEIPTGRVRREILWSWGDQQGSLGSRSSFPAYKETRWVWQPGIGVWRLPATIGLAQQTEIEKRTELLDASAVQESVIAAAWEQIRAGVPHGADIESPARVEMETLVVGDVEVVRATVTVETVQDIHEFRPLASPTSAGVGAAVKIQPVPGP